ncbi:MAG: hypothetical protein WD231_00130 [Candidatus Woykebacteria bacterium]
MKILEFGQDAKLSQILESIQAADEIEIGIKIPHDSLVFQNPINREIIERHAKKVGKKVEIEGAQLIKKVEAENFGFLEGEDVATKKVDVQEPIEKEEEEVVRAAPKPSSGGLLKFFKGFKGRKKLLLLAAGALCLLILFLGSFWIVPSAQVKVTVKTETKNNQVTLTASSKATEVDLEGKTIPLSVEEVTKSDIATGKSTGKLTVGAPAKGRVTIGNFSTVTSKKFSAGATVKSVSGQSVGLEFTLDSDVTVPKASSSGFNIVAGQAGVNVTAKKIGSEGNLPASTEFQVGSESLGTIKAVNDLAFSGGESKQVTAVSEADRKKLKEELLEKLKKEAEEELEAKLEGSKIPKGGLKTEITKENYDKAVGEEAEEFNLTLEVRAEAALFQESDLKKVLIESIKSQVPEGFKVDEDSSEVESELFDGQAEGEVEILGKIKAVIVPDFGEGEIAKNLSGKSVGAAGSYLDGLDNVSGFEIKINPAFFRIFNLLPFNSGRISVDIAEEESNSAPVKSSGEKNAE